MSEEIVTSDIAILDLLRKQEEMTVADLAEALEVTATAVRQRLTRLLAQGYIDRTATKAGRGRPSHRYVLTDAGRRKTGANFADLAVALWEEVRAIKDPEVQRGLLQRISKRLAATYADEIEGNNLEEKMESLADLFCERRIPFTVEKSEQSGLPVLTALACPYPALADRDRTVCAMERILFSELLGENLQLSQCRLDGDSCCTFQSSNQGTS